jgi:hypothetical protein
VGGDPDAYCYGRKLLERVGWEIYLGGDEQGHERWEPITRVRIAGDQVRITVTDGVTYVAGYVDAVRCRRPGTDRPGTIGVGQSVRPPRTG